MSLSHFALCTLIQALSTWFWLWYIIWENEQRRKEANE